MRDLQSLMNQEFAQRVCDIFLEQTGMPVIMANGDGIIFAATDKKRIGIMHSVAKKVMDGEISEGVVTLEEQAALPGVKAGINIPIVYKGVRISNLGIAGDPEIVRPYVGLASQIVQLWLQNQELLTDITETVGQINQELQEIAATVQQVTAGAQQIAQDSQNTYQTANESVNKIQNIEQVLQSIRNIASQSNLIGLNAAIEAARVGEAGRGFTVVANEVRKLATSSEESVKDISAVLEQIREIFMVIVNKVEQNKEVTQEQSSALLSVAQRVQSIEGNMSFLIGKIHE